MGGAGLSMAVNMWSRRWEGLGCPWQWTRGGGSGRGWAVHGSGHVEEEVGGAGQSWHAVGTHSCCLCRITNWV